MNTTNVTGVETLQPTVEPSTSVTDPPVGSPVLNNITGLATLGKNLRKADAKRIFDGGKASRLPNPVEAEVDVEALLNERFLADALIELRDRSGVLVSGDDPLSFEVVVVETLRTEAEGLFDTIKAEIDKLEPSKQVLLLTTKAILLTVDDKKTRKEFNLVRLSKNRSHVERVGIPLNLAKLAEPAEEPAS